MSCLIGLASNGSAAAVAGDMSSLIFSAGKPPPVGAIPEKLGEPLKVRVLYRGKPIAGARVIPDMVNDPDAEKIVTGDDGIASIRVRNQGLNVVNAIYDGPSDEPAKAAKTEHEATLTFVLQHAPE